MSWFKVDDKFYTSDKVLGIPRAERMAAVGLWLMLGNWCADQETDGVFPSYMVEEMGGTIALGHTLLDADLWVEIMPDEAAEKGFKKTPKGGFLGFKNWEKYQPTTQSKAAEREANREKLAKWRETKKQKNATTSSNENVTGYTAVTPSDVTGYNPTCNQDVTSPPTRPDPTRPDPKTKETPNGVSASKPKRATQLPNTWTPTPEHTARAQAEGLNLGREVETFRAHAEANGRTAKNWNAAFTQWLLKAQPQRGATHARPIDRQGDVLRSERERLESLTRQTPPDQWAPPAPIF